MKIILFAIPIFILSILVEFTIVRLKKRPFYRLNDSIANLSLGVSEQLVHLLCFTGFLALFDFTAKNLAFVSWSSSWWGWALAFMLIDMQYYWFHRASHRINVIWASHVVHHQSEEYNLTVALRQGPVQEFFSFWFYLPLAFLGLPLETFVTCFAINLVYQFWVHTRLIKTCPEWFELIFNTPAHHRVHHGRNPKYLDKNYAGVFIIWDRMFGSFIQEAEEPVYGITKPLNTFDPVAATVSYFGTLWAQSRKARNIKEAFLIWIKEPGWLPPRMGGFQSAPDVSREQGFDIFDPEISRAKKYVVSVAFLLTMGIAVFVLMEGPRLSKPVAWVLGVVVIISLSLIGQSMNHGLRAHRHISAQKE